MDISDIAPLFLLFGSVLLFYVAVILYTGWNSVSLTNRVIGRLAFGAIVSFVLIGWGLFFESS